jgi:hypothetical protein
MVRVSTSARFALVEMVTTSADVFVGVGSVVALATAAELVTAPVRLEADVATMSTATVVPTGRPRVLVQVTT